jgi:serine protease Do
MLKRLNRVLGKLARLLIVVSIAVVITAYYRPIQQSIHKGIANVYDVNETLGEALYHINGFLLNGKHFDTERSQKFVIYENYTRIVIVNVVNEAVTNTAFNGRGTGFFVKVTDTEGYIITNHHVIESAIDSEDTKIKIQTAEDYWTYDAEIVGYDEVADIGVLKITKQDNEDWKTLKFADRDDYNTGDPVVIIGHGMGMPWTTTQGYITHSNRFGLRPYALMVQTDAVINQGNSGGPILNLEGNVIGVAQAIYSPGRKLPGWDGVGVAISSDQALRAFEYIMSPHYASKGYVPYAEFPFSLATLELEDVKDLHRDERHMTYINYPELEEGAQPTIKTVGELAGLLQDDLIISINGEKIENSFGVMRLTLQAFPGDLWDVTIKRGDELISLKIALNEFDHKKIIKSIAKVQR